MFLSLLLAATLAAADDPPPIRGQIDWQGHPAMHVPWWMFGPGLDDSEPKLTNKHRFKQVVYTPYLDRSGVRIHLMAAVAAERARSPEQAKDLILEQLAYVEEWVAANADRYALARSAAEAREILTTTDKAVVVHSIEGGRELFREKTDADFWRSRGVALVTVVHLYDDELGGAALNLGLTGRLTNQAAVRKRRRDEDRGLTARGREVIVELADAGILVDLTHMSPQAVRQSLDITRDNGIPPVVTHGKLSRLRDTERAFTDEQVVDIYRQGGVFNLVLAGNALTPTVDLELPEGHCPGTLDDFRLHYQTLQGILDAALPAIFGREGVKRSDLTEAERVRLATGWASDWNGWTHHSAPRYGPGGCMPRNELPADALEVDIRGLAHPGTLPGHWQRLEEAGVDLDPMLLSAERFLQLWEQVDARQPDPR